MNRQQSLKAERIGIVRELALKSGVYTYDSLQHIIDLVTTETRESAELKLAEQGFFEGADERISIAIRNCNIGRDCFLSYRELLDDMLSNIYHPELLETQSKGAERL